MDRQAPPARRVRQGPPGSGATVTIPSNATPASDAAAAAWAALAPQVTVTSVSINSPPVVNFTVTDATGVPVKGLGNRQEQHGHLRRPDQPVVSLAKLVPGTNGAPSQWVSYIVTTVPTTTASRRRRRRGPAPTTPARWSTTATAPTPTRSTATSPQIKAEVDGMTVSGANNKADLGDLTCDPNLVHRLTIQLSGNAPGTGTNTPNGVEVTGYPGVPLTKPVDVIYDFIPPPGSRSRTPAATSSPPRSATNATASSAAFPATTRRVGAPASTAAAATRPATAWSATPSSASTGGPRPRSTPTTLTFTSANTYRVDGRAVGNLPNHIHKIHMGEFLAKKNYNYGGVLYNEVRFPQDLRNCTKCHDGSATSTAQTAQGDNWKNAPSRLACGACHDGINFATGLGVTIDDAARGVDLNDQLRRLRTRRPLAVRRLACARPATRRSNDRHRRTCR